MYICILQPPSKFQYKSNPSELQAPLDFSVTTSKACVQMVVVAYLDLFTVAARFAALPAPIIIEVIA